MGLFMRPIISPGPVHAVIRLVGLGEVVGVIGLSKFSNIIEIISGRSGQDLSSGLAGYQTNPTQNNNKNYRTTIRGWGSPI
jgi:hypothetical protein